MKEVINRTLPVCHPLTEVMGVQHYKSYEAFLLGSHSSLVVFKEKNILFSDYRVCVDFSGAFCFFLICVPFLGS